MWKYRTQQHDHQENIDDNQDQGQTHQEIQYQIDAIQGVQLLEHDYQELIAALSDSDPQVKFYGIIRLRQAIFVPIGIKDIMHVAHTMDFSVVHLQAVMTLCEIIQEDQVIKNMKQLLEQFISCIVETGGIPMFIKLIKSRRWKYIKMAIKSMNILSVKQQRYFQEFVEEGGIEALLDLLNHNKKKERIEDLYAGIRIINRGYTSLNEVYILRLIPTIIQIIIQQASNQQNGVIELYNIIIMNQSHMHQMEIYFTDEFLIHLQQIIAKDNKQIAQSALIILSKYAKLGCERADKLISLEILKYLGKMVNLHSFCIQLPQLIIALAYSEKNVERIISSKRLISFLIEWLQEYSTATIYNVFTHLVTKGNSKLILSFFHKRNIMQIVLLQFSQRIWNLHERFYQFLYFVIAIGRNQKEGERIILAKLKEKQCSQFLESSLANDNQIIDNWVRMIKDNLGQ